MKYIEEQGCIVRDLAARNILVGDNWVVKIDDFFLAPVTGNGIYTGKPG